MAQYAKQNIILAYFQYTNLIQMEQRRKKLNFLCS